MKNHFFISVFRYIRPFLPTYYNNIYETPKPKQFFPFSFLRMIFFGFPGSIFAAAADIFRCYYSSLSLSSSTGKKTKENKRATLRIQQSLSRFPSKLAQFRTNRILIFKRSTTNWSPSPRKRDHLNCGRAYIVLGQEWS